MIGVILAILHIMIAIYVAFRVLKQLYYMFENIEGERYAFSSI